MLAALSACHVGVHPDAETQMSHAIAASERAPQEPVITIHDDGSCGPAIVFGDVEGHLEAEYKGQPGDVIKLDIAMNDGQTIAETIHNADTESRRSVFLGVNYADIDTIHVTATALVGKDTTCFVRPAK
ncbi:hypothetical protein CAQU_02080 [Corynebacterium aquilae DSM 44791]|uniref:Uncharacterized protein n=2 Tax=Corynebacterium aquilae TaxID=203263 RepID=A0A1L7CE09_9CORY|nr:hypothetical protein CAQU_02080 [Corynebacterium aquilae DSM 44791]